MPAKAGIQNHLKILDSRLRGNDAKGGFKTFYETINLQPLTFYLLPVFWCSGGGLSPPPKGLDGDKFSIQVTYSIDSSIAFLCPKTKRSSNALLPK
jgi:hypothetical protein